MTAHATESNANPAAQLAAEHRRIYVASSWRNPLLDQVVDALRRAGHEVYDFREDTGFSWAEVRAGGAEATGEEVFDALGHEAARAAWQRDHAALAWADTVVLVLPAGSSAHLELGWAAGTGREAFVLVPADVPVRLELMWLEAARVFRGLGELLAWCDAPAQGRRDLVHRYNDACHLIRVMADYLGEAAEDDDDPHPSDLIASAARFAGDACCQCGCTELDPCDPPCAWAAESLCTSCQPTGSSGVWVVE